MKVKVVPHDPRWKSEFDREIKLVAQALGDVVVAFHHFGSTAIPGIFAKPIIDILLEVDSLAQLDEKTVAMTQLGYEAMGEFGIPGRRYFRKLGVAQDRTHQIHAFEAGSANIQRHLAFRNYLIAHPSEAEVYSALKQRLASEHPEDIEAYMDGKDAYIKEQEAKGIAWQSALQTKS